MYVILFKLNDYLRAMNKGKLKIKVIIYDNVFIYVQKKKAFLKWSIEEAK